MFYATATKLLQLPYFMTLMLCNANDVHGLKQLIVSALPSVICCLMVFPIIDCGFL